MGFTHYPKTASNVIFAWVFPAPPDKPNFLNHPRFATLNLMIAPLAPGASVVAYHSAQDFTRFFGSIASDQPMDAEFHFSNDETTNDGDFVTDENMKSLHWDAEALRLAYEPAKQSATGKWLCTIYGRWLRVSITNKGKDPTAFFRAYVRGSVF
jgi:hypothetical protein